MGAIVNQTCRSGAAKLHWSIDVPRLGARERRRDGDQTGVARANLARWVLRILVATTGVVVGLALAATSSYADTKTTPVGTSVGKLAQKARPGGGSSTATKARTKVVKRTSVPKVKIRMKAKAAPVRRVARKVAPVRTYRAAKVVRTVARRAPRPATVRPRISTVQRKAATTTVRAARKATAPKARPAQRAQAAPTKINRHPSKIIKSSAQKATTAKRSPSSRSAQTAQTGPVKVKVSGTVLRQRSVELALTVPALKVAGLPVGGDGVPVVVTPETKVSAPPVDVSVAPVGVTVPLLRLPTVTLPPAELPTVTLPRADLPTVMLPPTKLPPVSLPPTDPLAVTQPGSPVPVDHTGSARADEQTSGTPQHTLAGAIRTILTAYTPSTISIHAWAMTSIGPPAIAILDELGQRIGAAKVPAFVGPTTTALLLAAAMGAAATGTAGLGSAGASGPMVLAAALRLPALSGSRRLSGRLRESAFRRPRLPGFAPD